MKKFPVYLFVLALFSAVFAFAQEDGHRHGGGNGGGGGNSAPSRGERTGNSEDNGGSQQEKDNQKVQKPRKAENQQPGVRKQRDLGNGNGRSNAAPNWQRNNQVNHTNRNLNSQNQFPNRQGNQGLGGDRKRNGNGNTFRSSSKINGGNNGQPRGGQTDNGQRGSLNRNQSAAVPPRFQKMGINSVPQPIQNRSQILATSRQKSVITPPSSGPHGQVLRASVIAPRAMTSNIVQTHMSTITNSSNFRAQINVYNTNETRANNYYWHTWNGNNYCHYYDSWGYHWYGWYIGPNYFWTRYYGDNWWWYDGDYDRWCYWHDGGWWWQDPHRVNVVYVYNSGNYAPINSAASDYNGSNLVVFQSNDGTRKVKIMGDNRDAFLYDISNSPDFDPVFLSTGVKDVRFSDTSNGNPLQVILTLQNGSFQMYDANGNRYNNNNND